MCQKEAIRNLWAGYQMDLSPDPHILLTAKSEGVEKAPSQIAAKRLDIDENVNRACLIRHFLALNIGLENRSAFAKAPNE